MSTVLVVCAAASPSTRLLGRNAGWVLALPLLIAAALVVLVAEESPTGSVTQQVPWFPTLGVDLALRLDGLSLLFSLLVLVIGAAVLAYCSRYLSTGGRHGSLYVWMTAFAAAMLLLVLADDLVVLFVAWEATTLCSFFLIARSGPSAREPAIRTLLVTAAGGLSLLAAVVVMAVGTGTTRISEVLVDPIWERDGTFAFWVALLLAGAAFTKSAQFPFQAWLPDSMVAITPVSAYLHAAAMVKAGIYLLLRFSPALAGVTIWMALLVVGGLITALMGALAALRRNDLKELLAYSTMSQLGLLVATIGLGTATALTAAVVHTTAHALFKSALFMLVGVIDHQAGTRDIRRLAELRLKMPATATAIVLASASMAGVPLLLGFVSKESMFAAFVDAPGPDWIAVAGTAAVAATAVLTFAYSGRIVLGAFTGRSGTTVSDPGPAFWATPALCAAAGLVFGVAPFTLDALISASASASAGTAVPAYLELWHGFNLPLAISATVIGLGVALILARRRVDQLLAPVRAPISGLNVVDGLRAGLIRAGAVVGSWTPGTSPRRHLTVPTVCLIGVAGLAAVTMGGGLPAIVGQPSRQLDWLLLALVVAGVIAAVRAESRIAAIVVTGVVGFAMTLWFFVLGAADVALTQLLVEILTVCVMVLLLRRLPLRFSRERMGRRLPAIALAVGAGTAAGLGVWALTGRREMSAAATYYLSEGEQTTGGANIVNTILVDFRALDTLGELTVLGIAGVSMAALLYSRRPAPVKSAHLVPNSPILGAADNSVFVQTVTRVVIPAVAVLSLLLLLRGHQEPGGGFISALVGGAAFALLYLAAPSDTAARLRWPHLVLIGAGIVVGTGTGFLGYFAGSFLKPLHADVFGIHLTTALVFDVGVYLAVIGIVLAAFNLLGRQHQVGHEAVRTPRSRDRDQRDETRSR
ncbi:Multiple resistance and pH homeostasis protein A [Mycobacterium sp. smrl_JER01]